MTGKVLHPLIPIQLLMKLATSYISYDQAKKNFLELEIGRDSFETIYNKAQSKWDNQLGIITDVKGANYEQLVTLYSFVFTVCIVIQILCQKIQGQTVIRFGNTRALTKMLMQILWRERFILIMVSGIHIVLHGQGMDCLHRPKQQSC